ncbi:MAG: hypothetical protein OER91_00390 [Gammaproteobacteria bacterium]|nr:hypothetical protein [Gammaproteobacteria bacterium]
MAEKKIMKPVALAVGAALAGSFAISGAVNAADTAESPFSISNLEVGYMLGEGEGSCGGDKGEGDKKGEGSCGEGSCGEAGEKEGEGSCGEKEGEGSCGEKEGEGSCGEKDGEGKCGEGSCGGSA